MGLVVPDTGLLFWMIIAFSISLWILGKYAWKPIIKSLRKREDNIQTSLNAAKEAKNKMKDLEEENKKIIIKARNERDALLQEAKDLKNKMLRQAQKDAKDKADKILQDAQNQIENEKQKVLSDLKAQVADLTINISEKVLRRELDDKEKQKDYINNLVDEVKLN